MIRCTALALAATVSVGTLALATDAMARGGFGGGHFGGGFGGGHFGGMRDFGGGMRDFGGRDFHPEAMHEPRMDDRARFDDHRPAEDHRAMDDRHPDDAARRADEDHRVDDADRRVDDRQDARDHAMDDRRDLHDRALDHHDDLAHNWNNWHQPVNVGRWDHNAFWNDNWNGRHFNCYNCRWGWVGPVFWPFAWGDMWSFAWWPYADSAPFWNYSVDYMMGGLFWPNGAYAWPTGGYGATAWTQNDSNYVYARESHQDIYSAGPADGGDARQAAATDDSQGQDLATCSGFAPGVASFPVDKIKASVQPTGMQLTDLKALESASGKAEGILKASCPTSPPLTPIGRLDALQKRLDAMVQGLDMVRAPLAKFDGSLSADQRQALDALGGGKAANTAKLCTTQNQEFINVPTQEIIATVDPDDKQKAALDALDNVSSKAAAMLQATCPSEIPASTTARLDAMDKRLKATVTAMNEVRPALSGFYDSLSDEQKARFNTMPSQ